MAQTRTSCRNFRDFKLQFSPISTDLIITIMWCQVQATSSIPGQGCPPVRSKHAMCVAGDGHIYLYGGRSPANQPLRDLWRFDTAQNQWQEVITSGQNDDRSRGLCLSNSFDDRTSFATSSSSSTSSSPVAGDDRNEPPPPLQEHTIIAAKVGRWACLKHERNLIAFFLTE